MPKFEDLSFDERVEHLTTLVKALKPSQRTRRALEELLVYVRDIPERFVPASFVPLLALTFQLKASKVLSLLNEGSASTHEQFDELVPKSGWLCDYVEFTRRTEPPTAFHFFSAATVIGATLARSTFLPRGSGDLFPNLNCVLVAPPGVCKKTTACNLAVNLYRDVGGSVLADKITPEAIVESFKKQANATGLIYAPEWSVFLGRQQYLEGLVPMLTALFDCPKVWSSSTIMRGNASLKNVALSHLAATTIDWMQSSVTRDAFSGGFMSRLLFIVQKTTPRRFSVPPPLDGTLRKSLRSRLLKMQRLKGEFVLQGKDFEWYDKWYLSRKLGSVDKNFAGYFERKPERLLQIAMILAVSEDMSLVLDEKHLRRSERILKWIEHYMPSAFEELTATNVGDDQLRILKQIRRAGGELNYTPWLRQNTSRMSVDMFKRYLDTLVQAGYITHNKQKTKYYLLRSGNDLG